MKLKETKISIFEYSFLETVQICKEKRKEVLANRTQIEISYLQGEQQHNQLFDFLSQYFLL